MSSEGWWSILTRIGSRSSELTRTAGRGQSWGSITASMTTRAHSSSAIPSSGLAGNPAEIGRGLKAAGLDDDAETASALVGEVRDHARRIQLEQQELQTLTALDRPIYHLPFIEDAAELSGLQEIADRLQAAGMV